MNDREERKRELMKQRVFTWEEAEAQIAAWKARGEIVVFTNGCLTCSTAVTSPTSRRRHRWATT